MLIPKAETFSFDSKLKTLSLGVFLVGLVMFAIGAVMHSGHPTKIWAALLHSNFFFLAISLAAVFFIAAQTMGYNGSFTLVSRIPEAMGMFVPIGAILMIVILIFGLHDIYHWSHEGLTNQFNADGSVNTHYDKLLAHKEGFLNAKLFYTLSAVYLILWSVFAFIIRRNSLEGDKSYTMKLYKKSKVIAAIFLIIFAVSSSTAIWHWIMSVDPHWFSTLFGWYCFVSMFVGCMSTVALITIYLKKKGYLEFVTDEHVHDIGKYMFAFSVAWGYLWFSQFMLIWYANIPEETVYFVDRWDNFSGIFFFNFCINFITPFLILMTSKSKRNLELLAVMACILIFGHWVDYYLMIMPGALKGAGLITHQGLQGLGLLEFGLLFSYIGLFTFVVFTFISKAPLVQVNHPFVRESMTHHV